jgi:hypothetical protein
MYVSIYGTRFVADYRNRYSQLASPLKASKIRERFYIIKEQLNWHA